MAAPDIIDQLEKIVPTLTERHRVVVKEAIEKLQAMGEQLEAFKKSLASRYRPSSEKIDPGQLTLDLLGFMAQQEQNNEAASDDSEKDPADKPKKTRKKRRSKTKLLPIKEKIIPLSEKDKTCSCEKTMNAMGYEIRRQIVYERAKMYMLVEKLEQCGCGSCKKVIRTAEGTPKPIEGGLASSSLLAHIAVRKTVDAVPVERVGRILAREGAELAPSTLHDWFGFVGAQAGLIAPVAHQMLLASQLISLDDTRLLSKKHDERDGTQRGRLWMYVGDVNRVVVCRYSPNWKGTHPRKVLEGFQGNVVQLDGYGGLNAMFKADKTLQRVGCCDHLRRHFVQAFKDGDKRAAPIVEIFRRLYDIEALAKDRGLEPSERLELRQTRSRPIWDELGHAIHNIEGTVTKKSALGKGISYWRKQRPFLEVFLSDGFVPISNIHVEQLIRTVALFRHNSLFVGNTAAGDRYADLMTLMLNCALCGANPFDYLRDILDRLATGWPAKRVAELMPQAWLASKKSTEQPEQP